MIRRTLARSVLAVLVSIAVATPAATLVEGCACNHPTVEPASTVTVTDPEGQPVNGAEVTFRDASGTTETLTADPLAGDAAIAAGRYIAMTTHTVDGLVVHVEAPGFQPYERAVRSDEIRSVTGCGRSAHVVVQLSR